MPSRAVLLVNLGSPDSPTEPDVRRYLREFLMDGRVLDAPWPIRFCVVNFTILPTRPRESAHAYSTIWTAEGSPLIVTSRHVRRLLQDRLSVPVELAMRYQNPSIESVVTSLAAQGVDRDVPDSAVPALRDVELRERRRAGSGGRTARCPRHDGRGDAAVLRSPGLHPGAGGLGSRLARSGARPRPVQFSWPARAAHAQGRPDGESLPGVAGLLRDAERRAQDVLPGPVLQDRARLRGERADSCRQVFRLVSIPPRTGALDAARTPTRSSCSSPTPASRGCWCSALPSSPTASRLSRRSGCAGGIRS